ncbi:MAG TPA: glycoside hydrolase family 43 protein [Verrucomicrobiae bacterium]|jgi:GH43 family beta-xylosidase|nr:glycoside hydrolase family 43 protein [Verrucomicrobiae bacterium]
MTITNQPTLKAKQLSAVALVCCAVLFGSGVYSHAQPLSPRTFTNPVLPTGPDPWVAQKDGFYYYMNTTGNNLTVWKTRSIPDLVHARKKVVWTPPASGPYSKDIWAPEIHFLDGKWYIYFAADSLDNHSHRVWILENPSRDPLQGSWTMKGKLADASDKWAIDASVFENQGKLYAIWSGWEDDTNGTQNIYIAAMKNPWTIEGPRTKVSTPTYPWETVGDVEGHNPNDPPHINVNEGPEMLQHGDKLFLIYSASACWTENYCLGMLTASADANLLDAGSWKKSSQPVFSQKPEAQAYATGHCGFFKSPDGTEDWIIFHANPSPGKGCGSFRQPRAQKINWNADGTPDFGEPLPLETRIRRPSGDTETRRN